MRRRTTSYVYKITELRTGYFYIGVSSCYGMSKNHIGVSYFTSGCLKEGFRFMPSDFKVEVLYENADRNMAELVEALSIYVEFHSPKNLNFAYNEKLVEFPKKKKPQEMWAIYHVRMAGPQVVTKKGRSLSKTTSTVKSGGRQTVWCPKKNCYVPVTNAAKKKVKKSTKARNKASRKKTRW